MAKNIEKLLYLPGEKGNLDDLGGKGSRGSTCAIIFSFTKKLKTKINIRKIAIFFIL
mgnify:CR=1 FL=1